MKDYLNYRKYAKHAQNYSSRYRIQLIAIDSESYIAIIKILYFTFI